MNMSFLLFLLALFISPFISRKIIVESLQSDQTQKIFSVRLGAVSFVCPLVFLEDVSVLLLFSARILCFFLLFVNFSSFHGKLSLRKPSDGFRKLYKFPIKRLNTYFDCSAGIEDSFLLLGSSFDMKL